jgi:two-component system response regulator AtoC
MTYFLMRKHTAPGEVPAQIPPELERAFLNYQWPGNIRELENIIRKFLVLRDAGPIVRELSGRPKFEPVSRSTPTALPNDIAVHEVKAPPVPVMPALTSVSSEPIPLLEQLERTKREAERKAILDVLKATNWNRRQAAVLLHIEYKALLYKMKGLSIKKEKPNHVRGAAYTGD